MNQFSDVAILILAAGQSIRMGEPKQLLLWHKTTLLGHAINTAKQTCSENVFVVLGAKFEKLNKLKELEGTTVIFNPNYKSGQGTSLSCGIQHFLKTKNNFTAVLVMLCDQPLITKKYLKQLIITFKNGEKNIIATKYQNRAGVPAVFGNNYFQEMSMLTADTGARALITKYYADVIQFAANGKELDIDTKQAYAALKEKLKV